MRRGAKKLTVRKDIKISDLKRTEEYMTVSVDAPAKVVAQKLTRSPDKVVVVLDNMKMIKGVITPTEFIEKIANEEILFPISASSLIAEKSEDFVEVAEHITIDRVIPYVATHKPRAIVAVDDKGRYRGLVPIKALDEAFR